MGYKRRPGQMKEIWKNQTVVDVALGQTKGPK
jgi:hypothetical protein